MPIKSLQRESSSAVADSFFMEADDDALRRGDVAPTLPPPVPGVAGSGIATQPPTVAPFTPTVMAAFSALEAPVRTNTSVASEVSGMSLGGSPPPRPEGMDAGAQLPDIAPFTPAPSAAYGRRHSGIVGASAGLATDSMSLGGSPPPPSSVQMSLGGSPPACLASPAPDLKSPDARVDLDMEATILTSILEGLEEEDDAEEEAMEMTAAMECEWGVAELDDQHFEWGNAPQGSHQLNVAAQQSQGEGWCVPCDCGSTGTSALPHADAASTSALLPGRSSVPAFQGLVPAFGGDLVPMTTFKLGDVSKQPGTVSNAFQGFRCACPHAHGGSCLDRLTPVQMRAAYSFLRPDGESTTPTTFRTQLHTLLWSKKQALSAPNSKGHNYKITDWSYDQVPLCRRAFMKLYGGAYQAHRDMYGFVCRGVSPTDVACSKGADLLAKTTDKALGRSTDKAAFATKWLSELYLGTMEFMPNENLIMLRGVSLAKVHSEQFEPHAKAAGMRIGLKAFLKCLPLAATDCALRAHATEEDAAKVSVRRSARHSKFPQCTQCHDLRNGYISVASNPLADKRVLQRSLAKWMAHQSQFMKDRNKAKLLRLGSCLADSPDYYECDDKCGSHWCKAPVPAGGRDTKETATRSYEFSVQANVVCGRNGVMRLAIVPKNVPTGANFGLSTLLFALHSACHVRNGKATLPSSVRRLYRHTDGGPDNVSKLTHIFHWLLVYVGCWEELIWFMFDAGHSHTEIADRLFAMMKKLFETDGPSYVKGGILSFEQLEDQLKATFAKCPEMKEIVYHFANWDLDTWLKGAVGFRDDNLRHISYDKVYKYTYVGDAECTTEGGEPSNMAAMHGGVMVTYKKHLSDTQSNPLDDEWAPVERIVETNASGDQVQANRTKRAGVLFVTSPPKLTSEPPREELASAK